MDRRRYLATVGATLALAGCGEADSTATVPATDDRPTATQTAIDTATSTPAGTETPTDRHQHSSRAEFLGSNHSGGTYDFSDHNYLNQGAAVIQALGCGSIRTGDAKLSEAYPFDTDWPDSFETVADVYDHAYFRELFERPFDTFHLDTVSRYSVNEHHPFYWRTGLTEYSYEQELEEYEALGRHLLETYDGTATTFTIGHWEGDWALIGTIDTDYPWPEPDASAIRGMIRWLNARHEGIERARMAVDSDVTVLTSTSVNRLLMTRSDEFDQPSMITEVVPNVDVDLVSYSAWEVGEALARANYSSDEQAKQFFKDVLSYIHRQATEPSEYAREALGPGQPNVWLCEFGARFATQSNARRITRRMTEAAYEWGAPWAQFWQVFDNEYRDDAPAGRPTNEDVRGYYLLRPDGTTAESWDYFSEFLAEGGTEAGTPPYTPRQG